MSRYKQVAVLPGILTLALWAASCSHPPKPQTQTAAPAVVPKVTMERAPAEVPPPDQDLVMDERAILAAQRALNELGYSAGKADGRNGPATRRAIQAFQKDHGLTADGRLTLVLVKMLKSLVAQSPKSMSITVAAKDSIIYSDGSIDSAGHERVVQWDQGGSRAVVAVRPSTHSWPPAARAGLDWATTHALDDANGAPVQWSSTGVDSQFEIRVFPTLSSREAAIAGPSCRRFELREEDLLRRYPALACKDAKGDWYLAHTRILLARPAAALSGSGSSH